MTDLMLLSSVARRQRLLEDVPRFLASIPKDADYSSKELAEALVTRTPYETEDPLGLVKVIERDLPRLAGLGELKTCWRKAEERAFNSQHGRVVPYRWKNPAGVVTAEMVQRSVERKQEELAKLPPTPMELRLMARFDALEEKLGTPATPAGVPPVKQTYISPYDFRDLLMSFTNYVDGLPFDEKRVIDPVVGAYADWIVNGPKKP